MYEYCTLPSVARQRLGNDVHAQRRPFGGVVFYEVGVVSRENRLLVLPQNCCLQHCWWAKMYRSVEIIDFYGGDVGLFIDIIRSFACR
jgi:hypothetical protein